MSNKKRGHFKGFLRLATPYWISDHRWKAIGLLAAVIALTLGSVFMSVQLNTWNRLMFDALQHFDKLRLIPLVGRFALIIFGIIGIGVYNQFLTQLLQIRWREWMTNDMLRRWLEYRTFYFMQISEQPIENSDQRMAQDIKEFIDLTLSLSLGLLRQTVTLLSFVGILWSFSGILHFSVSGIEIAIPGYLAIASLAYAVIGSFITHKIGDGLTQLNYDQQRYEADFRFSLVRIRENAESIVLHQGEKAEELFIKKKFTSIVSNFMDLIKKQKQLGFFTFLFNNSSQLVPMILVTPRYFSKAIELGGMMQTINAFGSVENAFAWFVNNYVGLSHWQAVVQRLEGFDDCINRTDPLRAQAKDILKNEGNQSEISIKDLTLRLPTNQILLRDINFTIPKGGSVLLHGPSGCGKSTLLRVISGAWPFASGQVCIPSSMKVMIIPQKPYLPIDILRATFAYPLSPNSINNGELISLLKLCRLDHLESKLDVTENWGQILSPGEQQRIAFVRIFLQKPQILFLDEATSALDEETQTQLYQAITQRLPGVTVVSIAHRSSLIRFHTLHFDVNRHAFPPHISAGGNSRF